MGLAETQHVLARVYTDAAVREKFFADPQKAGEEFGLSFDEARQLARLAAPQVLLFAGSLRGKRLQAACELLPLTSRALGDRTASLFTEHAASYLPKGIKKHRDDAIAFAAFVEKNAGREDTLPEWIAEVARYERGWLEAADPARRLIVSLFRHHIAELTRAVAGGVEQPILTARPILACWLRLTPRGTVRHTVLPLPLPRVATAIFRIINFC
ncbi:MAG TPA: hypothetical protein VM943_13480 [Pyrinomonadaceae bacterium]|nr:hypothetical protein [Pyrinomonadaceae bacterium]